MCMASGVILGMRVGLAAGQVPAPVASKRVEFRQARELWQPPSNAAPDATTNAITPSTEYGFQEFFGDQSASSTATLGDDRKRKLSDVNDSSDNQAKKSYPDNLVNYWCEQANREEAEGTTSQEVDM
jgi:hypothetical protein